MTQEQLNAKKLREQCWRARIAACEASGKTIVQWRRGEGITRESSQGPPKHHADRYRSHLNFADPWSKNG